MTDTTVAPNTPAAGIPAANAAADFGYPICPGPLTTPRSDEVPPIDLAAVLGQESANPMLTQVRLARGLLSSSQVVRSAPPVTAQDAPGAGAGSSSRPSAVDWTDRWNTSWLGTVKAQVGGDCYLYAAAGLVEAMTRIEHSVWATRSEDDAGDALSFLMGSYDKDAGGGPNDVLDWVKANGIADYGCWKGNGLDAVANPSPDRLGRTVKLDAWQWVPGADAMKDWLDANGPLAVCFNLYDGFGTKCSRTQVYMVGASETNIGRHCLQIVGYDDTKQAWLIRNSWGTGWGTGGYGWYGYGQGDRGLEYGAAIGIVGSSTSPDPHTKRRLHNGNIIESGNGIAHRDFEVFMIAPGNKIARFVHDGGTKLWSLAETLPAFALPPNYTSSGFDCAHTPAATASTYFRDYELVFQTTGGDLRHCFWDQIREQWRATHPAFGPSDVDGPVAFVQLGNGAPGDFEVVVKRSGGTLENWYRDNVHNTAAWSRRSAFGAGVRHGGRSLVERFLDDTTNVSGGLDYVCVTSDQRMQRWWRDDAHSAAWQACETFGAGIDSSPTMIRSQVEMSDEKHYGRYELCVATGGKIQSWWSAGNPQPTTSASWQLADTFGTDQSGKTVVEVLGFMSSSFGFDYEVIALLSDYSVQHFWRDANGWHAGVVFASEH